MRSHVTKTVSACFAVLRQLRSIRRSVPRSVFQSLVTSLVLTRLDYGNSTLAGIPLYLLKRLQSVMNSADRLVFGWSRYDHITPLLRQLHWLTAAERIDFNLALLVYKCQHGAAPSYLADELRQPADCDARRRPRSASSPLLIVCRTRMSTISRSPLPVFGTVYRTTSRRHSEPSLAVFRMQSPQDGSLQALLSIIPFRCCACEMTLVIVGHFVLRTICGDACPLSCVSAEDCLTGWPNARGRRDGGS